MQYNILSGALCEVSTISGHKLIDFNDIYLLSDYSNTPVFNLNSSEILSMDFDFGHRIHLDRFEYKFISSDASPPAVASGIKFFFKDESFDTYMSLNTFIDSDIFYTTMDSIFAPRYIRITHTLSGTYGVPTSSGSVYGFRALNNDTIVDFGIDGNLTAEYVETARGGIPVVKTIPIYNSGIKKSDALINLEPTFSPVDEVMYISSNENGPWVKALDPSNVISDTANFSAGYTTGLQYINGPLRMTGVDDCNSKYATKFLSDYYLTRIFEKNNSYCRFIINNVGIGGRISVDKTDVTETIEVRSSNTKPTPYMVIRELRNVPVANSSSRLGYRDRWLNTQAIKEESSWTFLSCSLYSAWRDYKVVFDQSTERWAGYATHTTTSSFSTAELYLFNNVGTTSSKTYRLTYQSVAGIPITFTWRELKLDVVGGMWVYFYCQSFHQGDFVSATGYFLAYFDSELNNTFKWFTVTEEIGKMDNDYNGKCVWYTRLTTQAIYRLDINGDIQVNFIDEDVTYDLGGIAVMPDNNLIFANGKDLHRLKYNGIYLPEYFMEGVVETRIDYIVLDDDGSEAIWTIEGMTVGRLYIAGEKKGTYDFRVTVDYPSKMVAVLGGVWVTCSDMDGHGGVAMRFVSKENRKVDLEYRPSYVSSPGLLYQPYTHTDYARKLPINIDTVWSTLPWKKVAINGFLAPEDCYYQLRIIMRRQEPIERYPEFITDSSQEFISDDSFDQISTTPNELIWGDWLYYPSLNRVNVDTINKNLILVPDPGNSQNSYINTKNRFIVSRDVNGDLDIRIRYTIGAGNGIASDKAEVLYLIAYSASPGYYGKYIGARLRIPISTSSPIFLHGGHTDDWSYSTYWTGLNMYEHDLRLYWNGSVVYAQWKNINDTNFITGGAHSVASGEIGDHFYVQIESDRNGSQVKIDNFDIYSGDVYYYAESPQITSIHKQELLEVKDIYPNNHKNVYVKTYVPKDLEIDHRYDMDMKVRWRIPI
jgi:hypothetical protein